MQKYPDDIILTRVGMFYEVSMEALYSPGRRTDFSRISSQSYFTQAAEVASLLNIRLTSKSFRVRQEGKPTKRSKAASKSTTPALQHKFPFAGFPISQREKFFQMLLELGRSFVVVEEKDKSGSTSKDRFVARRYTPGTLLSEAWQISDETRHLLALSLGNNKSNGEIEDTPVGLAYIDVSTDRAVQTRTSTLGELEHELARISPVEVVLQRGMQPFLDAGAARPSDGTELQGVKEISATVAPLLQQSGATIAYVDTAECSAGATELEASAERLIQTHLKDCLLSEMPKLLEASHQSADSFMQIDASTLLGLEIRQSLRQSVGAQAKGVYSSPASRAGTLLSVIKRTLTPSGTRLLVNTLCQPSTDLHIITQRHDLVEAFLQRSNLREDLRYQLKQMSNAGNGEISRIIQRFSANGSTAPGLAGALAGGRDLWDLKQRIEAIERLGQTIQETLDNEADSTAEPYQRLRRLVGEMKNLEAWVASIDRAVVASVLDKSAVTLGEQPDTEPIAGEEESDEVPANGIQSSQENDNDRSSWWIDPK